MLSEKIKHLRVINDMTQKELADMVELVSQKSISMYEKGHRIPPIDVLVKIAEAFGVTTEYLLGRDERMTSVMVPVVGEVRAGIPLYAQENIIDYEEISPDIQGELFALKVKGYSMAPRVLHGDLVIVRKQNYFESGDVCVVLVNSDEVTIKKVEKREGGIMIIPTNINYTPTFYTEKEINDLPVQIIGKVVELRGKL